MYTKYIDDNHILFSAVISRRDGIFATPTAQGWVKLVTKS
jgi:hypothetical protein